MLTEQTCDLLVQLADLLLKELQLLQRHLQQPAIDGVELRTRTQCIAQLFWRSAQLLIGQGSQSCRIRFAISQRLQHAPSTGAQ